MDRSDRNGLFHLTSPAHSQSQDLAVRYVSSIKYPSLHFYGLLRADLSVLLVHQSDDRSVVVSQAKCMFWLLTPLKDDLFPETICNVLFVIGFEDFECGF